TAVKLSRPDVQVIGVEPELANDAQQSLRSGAILELSAEEVSRTIADGLRTQSIGEINFEHIRRYVNAIMTVSDDEMIEAMRRLALTAKLVAEPSGAVTTAAFMFHALELPRSVRTVAVISGGSVEPELLSRALVHRNGHRK